MAVNFTHTDYTDELNRIIVALTGIRNDIRLLSCGPRAGFAELILPPAMRFRLQTPSVDSSHDHVCSW